MQGKSIQWSPRASRISGVKGIPVGFEIKAAKLTVFGKTDQETLERKTKGVTYLGAS